MDMIAWCKPHGNLWEYGKFVGDASIANLIHSLCDLLTFANINNRAHLQVLQLPSERQKTKRHSASRGLRPLTSYRGLCTMDLRARGAPPADPRYMCALRARHGIRTLCSSKLILKNALLTCVAKMQKTRFSQKKTSNLELRCLLTTYCKSHMGFSKNPLPDP